MQFFCQERHTGENVYYGTTLLECGVCGLYCAVNGILRNDTGRASLQSKNVWGKEEEMFGA